MYEIANLLWTSIDLINIININIIARYTSAAETGPISLEL